MLSALFSKSSYRVEEGHDEEEVKNNRQYQAKSMLDFLGIFIL